jgi:hypothetical protein
VAWTRHRDCPFNQSINQLWSLGPLPIMIAHPFSSPSLHKTSRTCVARTRKHDQAFCAGDDLPVSLKVAFPASRSISLAYLTCAAHRDRSAPDGSTKL